jgi:hypothetical protein
MIWCQLQSRIKNLLPPEVDRIVLYELRSSKMRDKKSEDTIAGKKECNFLLKGFIK